MLLKVSLCLLHFTTTVNFALSLRDVSPPYIHSALDPPFFALSARQRPSHSFVSHIAILSHAIRAEAAPCAKVCQRWPAARVQKSLVLHRVSTNPNLISQLTIFRIKPKHQIVMLGRWSNVVQTHHVMRVVRCRSRH